MALAVTPTGSEADMRMCALRRPIEDDVKGDVCTTTIESNAKYDRGEFITIIVFIYLFIYLFYSRIVRSTVTVLGIAEIGRTLP